jgi:hypothetical protein
MLSARGRFADPEMILNGLPFLDFIKNPPRKF